MITYLVFAVHAFSNGSDEPEPLLRTQSREIAEAIVAQLKEQRFTVEGRRLKRYSSVFMQQE